MDTFSANGLLSYVSNYLIKDLENLTGELPGKNDSAECKEKQAHQWNKAVNRKTSFKKV